MAKTRKKQHTDDEEEQPLRRAGQREDELLPGQTNEDVLPEDLRGDAAGSPDGGLNATGIGGTTRGDGSPNPADAEDALGSEVEDDLSDTVQGAHPASGRAGGAIGGTPVGKRARPR